MRKTSHSRQLAEDAFHRLEKMGGCQRLAHNEKLTQKIF
jgi:hypothetical protein